MGVCEREVLVFRFLVVFFNFVFISLFSLGVRINNQTPNMTKDSFSDFHVSLLLFFFF